MSWRFDKPLSSLSVEAKNEADKKLWEAEDLGGLTEDNNRLPVPVVGLVFLTVLTAFFITMPLWGQRPTAALYAGYVKTMDNPEIQAIQSDAAAMERIVALNQGTKYNPQLERHPTDMNQLRQLKPKIEELARSGADLEEYTVLGNEVVLANFEGNKKADGTPTRKQPWWDKGYTIDIFYLTAFFLGVVIVIKRLPPSSWQPRHGHGGE
jgi:hypothetical protein